MRVVFRVIHVARISSFRPLANRYQTVCVRCVPTLFALAGIAISDAKAVRALMCRSVSHVLLEPSWM